MKTMGITFMLVVVLAAVVPLFAGCPSPGQLVSLPNGKRISRCHWTGRAEPAMGAGLAAIVRPGREESAG